MAQKVLVVGVGFMGSLHARTVRGSRQGVLCGVVDRNEAVVRAVGAELGVPAYTDLQQAIDETAPDAAIVATPDPAHREPAEVAIDAGLAVLVEKPLATTVKDAEAIVTLAEQRGARLMTGHIGRFHLRYVRAAEAARSGRLGKPVMATVTTFGLTGLGARVANTTNPLWHFAIHDIDAIQWATGGVVADVYGAQIVESDAGLSVFSATGSLSTGCGFHLAAGWTLPGEMTPRRNLIIHGDEGVAEATWLSDGITISSADGPEDAELLAWPTLYGNVTGALSSQVEHFLSAVADGTPFVITTQEAVDAVRSAAALEKAAVVRRIG